MFGVSYFCVRCGDPGVSSDHCNKCEAEYQAELQDEYEAGQPHPQVVGRAFGGEIAIWVHEKAEHCGCRGGGWHTTDLDSVHPCPIASHEGPHPEAY